MFSWFYTAVGKPGFHGIVTFLVLFFFLWKILLANNVDPDQMPHTVTVRAPSQRDIRQI